MPQTKEADPGPTPDEKAGIRLSDADLSGRINRWPDCAEALIAVLSNVQASLHVREEAARGLLGCALALEGIRREGAAIPLLDRVRCDKTLRPSLREKAADLIVGITERVVTRDSDIKSLADLP